MHIEVDPEKIVKLAMTMELHGSNFYQKMADQSKDNAMKAVFLRLAEEEEEHYWSFKKLLDGIKPGTIKPGVSVDYLQALVKERLFQGPLEGSGGIIDVLATGIQAEKDAILLYQELYNLIQDPSGRSVLNKLLEAEKRHLVELREQLEDLTERRNLD